MSKYAIATFIVCSVEGFACYLIGYMVGITHDKRTITHECVKDTHDKTEPNCSEKPNNLTRSKMEQVDKDTNVRSKAVYDKWGNVFDARADIEDEPQTDPCDGCVCDDGKHLMYCMNCKGIAWKTEPPKVEDEPQAIAEDINRRVEMGKKEWNVRHIEVEPQTEFEDKPYLYIDIDGYLDEIDEL